MDDLLIIGNDPERITMLKQLLNVKFDIKDLRLLKYFLGIEVAWSPSGIVLSQRKHTIDILQEVGLSAAKPSSTPMD